MEELTSEELKDVQGGATIEGRNNKLISKHVKSGNRFSVKQLFTMDGIEHRVFIEKVNWAFGGNNCAFIINGRKYDAKNSNTIVKNMDISNAIVEFYKAPEAKGGLVYVELGLIVKTSKKFIGKVNIYRINVFID